MGHILIRLWQGWKRVAQRIGEVQSRVFLTLLYFLLFAPLTLIARFRDPLELRRHPGWRPYHGRSADLPSTRRQ